jgi:hypothetical protein
MREICDPTKIIVKLDKMHCNIFADGTWVSSNEKDTKIIALTSSIQEIKKKFGKLQKNGFFADIKPVDGGGGGAKVKPKGGTKSSMGKPKWGINL